MMSCPEGKLEHRHHRDTPSEREDDHLQAMEEGLGPTVPHSPQQEPTLPTA